MKTRTSGPPSFADPQAGLAGGGNSGGSLHGPARMLLMRPHPPQETFYNTRVRASPHRQGSTTTHVCNRRKRIKPTRASEFLMPPSACVRETESLNRGFTRKSHTFLPKIFRKMSTQSSKERPENLHFPFFDDDTTISTVKESKTLFIIRGLPGSGKSTLAQAIQDQYKDACKVISADTYKITPAIRSSIPEDYSKLDEDLVDYCKRDITVVVVDDTHHERERLDQLFDIADKYQYKVLFVEPKTPWKMDCLQLKDKNQWKLSVEDLKKMKPSLEKDFLPLYYGWFLSKKSSENLRKTGQAFLDELGSLKVFKKESKYFLPAEDPKVKLDLSGYFAKRPPSVLHCTTKFTDFGKALGADEYAQQEVVKASYGKAFNLTISALFLTTKTAGARVELSEQELLLWPGDVDKILPTDNLPKGSRAHITLGCASGIEPVQTGIDLLEFVKLEKAGTKGDEIEEIGGGKLQYFGNGMWMLLLSKKIEVKAIFSGYYGKGKLVPTQGSNKRGSAFNPCTII